MNAATARFLVRTS